MVSITSWIKNKYAREKSNFELSTAILHEDKVIVVNLMNRLLATKVKESRAEKYYIYLRLIIERGWLKSYHNISEPDLYRYLAMIEHNDELGPEAKRDYKLVVKRVLEELNNPYSKLIKITSPKRLIPRYYLTVSDVLQMLKSDWPYLRDKAIMACLYESNMRPHEFFLLKWDDVRFEILPAKMWDGNGGFLKINLEVAWVTVSRDAKTGMRVIPLVFTVPWLKAWADASPDSDDYVFTELRGARAGSYIEYPAARKAMKQLAKSAGIDYKKLQLYSSRRGRNTELCNILTYAQQCVHAGWRQDSDMPMVYNQLAGINILAPLLAPFGIVLEKMKNERATWIEIMKLGQFEDKRHRTKCG